MPPYPVQRGVIFRVGVVQRNIDVDREIRKAPPAARRCRERSDFFDAVECLLRLNHRDDEQLRVHGIHVFAIALELAPLAPDAGGTPHPSKGYLHHFTMSAASSGVFTMGTTIPFAPMSSA